MCTNALLAHMLRKNVATKLTRLCTSKISRTDSNELQRLWATGVQRLCAAAVSRFDTTRVPKFSATGMPRLGATEIRFQKRSAGKATCHQSGSNHCQWWNGGTPCLQQRWVRLVQHRWRQGLWLTLFWTLFIVIIKDLCKKSMWVSVRHIKVIQDGEVRQVHAIYVVHCFLFNLTIFM